MSVLHVVQEAINVYCNDMSTTILLNFDYNMLCIVLIVSHEPYCAFSVAASTYKRTIETVITSCSKQELFSSVTVQVTLMCTQISTKTDTR